MPGDNAPGVNAPGETAKGAGAGPGGAAGVPQLTAWATELSDRVVQSVDRVKARTTLPVVTVLRAIVYALVVLAAVTTALVLGVLGTVRIWDVYVPLGPLGRRVWLGYVVVGGALFLAGGALLARRKPGSARR